MKMSGLDIVATHCTSPMICLHGNFSTTLPELNRLSSNVGLSTLRISPLPRCLLIIFSMYRRMQYRIVFRSRTSLLHLQIPTATLRAKLVTELARKHGNQVVPESMGTLPLGSGVRSVEIGALSAPFHPNPE